MNKRRYLGYLTVILALIFIFNISGCSKTFKKPALKPGQNLSSAPQPTRMSPGTPKKDMVRTFTREELSKYNGRNGKPAYVAVDGKVYDMTKNTAWKYGQHHDHKAGTDMTKEINHAPHGKLVLRSLLVVGKLSD